MARKRTIDPDFWTDEKIQAIPWAAVGFAVGLIQFADDEGRLEWSPVQLAARICGSRDDVSRADVVAWMQAIAEVGLVQLYTVNKKTYAYYPTWRQHQYINRRQPSRLPVPPDEGNITEPSVNTHGAFTEDSLNTHGTAREDSLSAHGALTEDSVNTHGAFSEDSVPNARGRSDSGSSSDSPLNSSMGGAAGKPAGPCECEAFPGLADTVDPTDSVGQFLTVFANRRVATSQRVARAAWTATLREMRVGYSWEQIWSAFAQTHRDGNHAPFHAFGGVWSNLRALHGRVTSLRREEPVDLTAGFRRV